MSSLGTHLPALQIIIPLLAAPLCVLMPSRRLSWAVTLAAAAGAFVVALSLFFLVQEQGGVITYHMGNWRPPFGIEYRVDYLSAFMLVLVSGTGAVMLPYAAASVKKEIAKRKIPVFYAVYLLCFAGLQGIVITNDAFNLYVFLEISSLATYALIAMGKDRRAVAAAFQYLILGTIGATFILIGIGLLYQMSGTLNITDLAQRIHGYEDTRTMRAAFAFFIVGLSLKLALFPLHMWLPNAYAFSPSFVSAFLAATATKVSVYALLRVVLTLFGVDFSFNTMPLAPILILLSLLAIVMGSLSAIFQSNIKTLFAYSSIAQTGYITLGIALGTSAGVTAGMLHVINHSVTKGALFLALGAVSYRLGKTDLQEIRGLGKTMPLTALILLLGGLGLIGVPLTAGFISKWYLLEALLAQEAWFLVGVVIIGSLLALIYVWRLVELLYLTEPSPAVQHKSKEAPLSLLIPTACLLLLSLLFGVHTEYSLGVAQQAAAYVMGSHIP